MTSYKPIFKGNEDFIVHYTSQNCLTQYHKIFKQYIYTQHSQIKVSLLLNDQK